MAIPGEPEVRASRAVKFDRSNQCGLSLVYDFFKVHNMAIVNIHEAKTHFSKLVDKAMKGEEVIIGKSGMAVVKIVAIRNTPPKRVPGALKGLIRISDDFDAPLSADILDEFEGK